MVDWLYNLNKQAWMNQEANVVDLDTNNINASLVRASTYTANQDTDDFYDDVTTPVQEADGFLAMTVVLENADAANFTFSAVGAGAAIDILVVWQDTTVDGTSRVIAKYDISVTPDGNDINILVNVSGLWDL